MTTIRRQAPQAQIIYASTTPTREAGNLQVAAENDYRVQQRNVIARDLTIDLGLGWNDLYTLATAHTEWFAGDGVHYEAAGSRGLATACAAMIRQLVQVPKR